MADTTSDDLHPAGAPTSQATLTRSAGRVLIADTDAPTLKAVAVALRQTGRVVVTAPDGATALRLLMDGDFDVLLADVRCETPHGNLLSVAQREHPNVMRVAMASYASLNMALLALQAGAYAYLVKPLDIEELSITVTHALERLRLERELAAQVAELELAHTNLLSVNERLREQVDAATAELRVKVDELETTNKLLRDAQSQNQRFIQMVAHEMRGPLNPIINYAQIAKNPKVTTEARDRYMDTIVEHALRLNRLVGDLQTATRLSQGQFTLLCEPYDVCHVVAELVNEYTAAQQERVFTIELPPEAIVAVVDRDRVSQAVRNLLDNAVKYSAPNGAIETCVKRDDANLSISVGDYGAGIPEAEMKRIFEPFIRLDRQAGEVSGSGLGLFITRGIANAHGGSLSVRNRGEERASGAIFTVTLPLAGPTAPEPIA